MGLSVKGHPSQRPMDRCPARARRARRSDAESEHWSALRGCCDRTRAARLYRRIAQAQGTAAATGGTRPVGLGQAETPSASHLGGPAPQRVAVARLREGAQADADAATAWPSIRLAEDLRLAEPSCGTRLCDTATIIGGFGRETEAPHVGASDDPRNRPV